MFIYIYIYITLIHGCWFYKPKILLTVFQRHSFLAGLTHDELLKSFKKCIIVRILTASNNKKCGWSSIKNFITIIYCPSI